MDQNLITIAKKTLNSCLKKGGSAGEVLMIESKNLHLEVEEGKIDVIKSSTEKALAVRILIGKSPGFGFSTDFSPSSIDSLIEKVLVSARNTDEDFHYIFPLPQKSSISSAKEDKFLSIGLTEKLKRCQEMEKAAYSADPRIKAARQISYTDNIADIYLVNSNGVDVSFSNSSCTIFIMVVAKEGDEAQMSWEMDIETSYDSLKWSEVAQEAAKKALAMLGARSIKTCKVPIILSPPAAMSIFGAFAPAFYADSVQKERSLMAGRLGEIVGSSEVNITDDGLLPKGLATAPYDGEGVPMQTTKIIEKGRLKAYLYDTYTANKDGGVSTGNAVRQGARSQPQVGATNMFIETGGFTEQELLASIKEGLYVSDIMGAHTINPISGDFSIGATGHWIEKGHKAFPVRAVTLSGNMLNILKNISSCADNLRFYGHFGSPSILISEMIIAGENG